MFAGTAAGFEARPPSARALIRLVSILTRADPGAIGVVTAAAAVAAAIIAVGSRRRSADCSSTVDASADRRARYWMISIAASGISPTGISASDADTASMNSPAVKASTPVAAATAPTREGVIRDEAGADDYDCCQSSESTANHGFPPVDGGVVHSGSNDGAPAVIRTRRQPSPLAASGLDLDQRSRRFDRWHWFAICSSCRAMLAQKSKLLAFDNKSRCGRSAKSAVCFQHLACVHCAAAIPPGQFQPPQDRDAVVQ